MATISMVETAHLYAELHDELIGLLEGFSADDWLKPTVCKGWQVRDVAAHMLDTQLRILSMGRDGFVPASPEITSYQDLVRFLNDLNAEWVTVMRRLSTAVLLDLLRDSGRRLSEHVISLDAYAPALFPVAWAGESQSLQWFDIGRNYTEYWHHQKQIRDAVGVEGLTSRKWLGPVLALFVRAVPRAYAGSSGGRLRVAISGEAGGTWDFVVGESGDSEATVGLDQDTAWRLFTKGLPREIARERITISGDPVLGEKFLDVLAVMA